MIIRANDRGSEGAQDISIDSDKSSVRWFYFAPNEYLKVMYVFDKESSARARPVDVTQR